MDRWAACPMLTRRLQAFRYRHDCSGYFRLEHFAGSDLHPLESAAFSRRTPYPVGYQGQLSGDSGHSPTESRWNPHWKMAVATYKRGPNAGRLAHDLNSLKSPQEFFPEDLQLQFSKAVTDAAVDAKAKGQMLPRPLTIDDELVCVWNRRFIAVARQVPHREFVAFADLLAAQHRI